MIESEGTSQQVTESQVIYIEREQDPFLPNRLLSEAAEKGYILTSKQIHEILGIRARGKSLTA